MVANSWPGVSLVMSKGGQSLFDGPLLLIVWPRKFMLLSFPTLLILPFLTPLLVMFSVTEFDFTLQRFPPLSNQGSSWRVDLH